MQLYRRPDKVHVRIMRRTVIGGVNVDLDVELPECFGILEDKTLVREIQTVSLKHNKGSDVTTTAILKYPRDQAQLDAVSVLDAYVLTTGLWETFPNIATTTTGTELQSWPLQVPAGGFFDWQLILLTGGKTCVCCVTWAEWHVDPNGNPVDFA